MNDVLFKPTNDGAIAVCRYCNAVYDSIITRVGSSVAHHGRLDGDRYRWTKVK